MRQLDADALGPFEDRDGRRCARDQPDYGARLRAFRCVRRVDQRVVDDRRAAHVGDAVLLDQFENFCGLDFAQADVDAGGRRDRPWKTPAVAVEHRQCPQIDRMLAEIARKDVTDGVQVGTAVVGHHALGIARCSRGVAERDGVPFVFRQPGGEVLIGWREAMRLERIAPAIERTPELI